MLQTVSPQLGELSTTRAGPCGAVSEPVDRADQSQGVPPGELCGDPLGLPGVARRGASPDEGAHQQVLVG